MTGLSALALTAGLGACATVTRGSTEQFKINTTPPGAQAHTSSGFNCESTPCAIRMPRKDGFTITVTKAGYQTVTVDVKPKLAGSGGVAFVGNALIGGVIGAAVDVGSGATMDLTPNPLDLTLVPVGAVNTPAPTSTMAAPPPPSATVAVASPDATPASPPAKP